MINVQDALDKCLDEAVPLAVETRPLDEVQGLVLAEDVISDIDSPPFDKALMDGFAVRSEDIRSKAGLRILETITAGQVPTKTVEKETCTRIMTGAPIPKGADAVVRNEDTVLTEDGSRVLYVGPFITSGENLLKRAATMRIGQPVLKKGRELRPQELGLLAELGQTEIPVRRRPKVAVLATGDELVPVNETPKPGQIRNSNETMLAAQIQRAGGIAEKLGIARDNRPDLAAKIKQGLECDLLILSGGVSAGTLDLVPSELANAGVQEVFHKVNVKPGKPVWFGVKEDGETRCLVFGLPGNPVSSMVCFELFARPVIRKLMGYDWPYPDRTRAQLLDDFYSRDERPVYHPARLERHYDEPAVSLVPWQGSSDLKATVDADCMVLFPENGFTYREGTWIDVIPW